MIRRIVPDDLQGAVLLLKRLHNASRYARFKPHWPTVVATITNLSASPAGRVIVAKNGDAITGILIGLAQEFWWAEPKLGPRIASDLIFYSEGKASDAKEMMSMFVEWAWTVPRVVHVEVGVSSGMEDPDAIDRFYKYLGFNSLGSMFYIEHPKLRS